MRTFRVEVKIPIQSSYIFYVIAYDEAEVLRGLVENFNQYETSVHAIPIMNSVDQAFTRFQSFMGHNL